MHHPLVRGANDFWLSSLEGHFRRLLVALGDCFLDVTHEGLDTGAARLIDRIAAGGNAGGFFCRTGVGHWLLFPLKDVLLPQTKTCPLAGGKEPVAGSQNGPVYRVWRT